MEEIQIKEPEHLLVYRKGYSADFVRQTIERRGLKGLRIFDHLDPLPSLDFLREFSFLKQLSISSLGDHDYSFLKLLTNLTRLSISTSVTNDQEINLSHQINLVELVIYWRENIKGLEFCQRLEKLMLIDHKRDDLAEIQSLSSLKELSIKTSRIKNLNGMDRCKQLENIELGPCKRLQSIKGLSHLHRLRRIMFDEVPKVQDYGELKDLPNLSEIELIDCGKIPSIGFIKNFPSLKKMELNGSTEIADGDTTPAKKLKKFFYAYAYVRK